MTKVDTIAIMSAVIVSGLPEGSDMQLPEVIQKASQIYDEANAAFGSQDNTDDDLPWPDKPVQDRY